MVHDVGAVVAGAESSVHWVLYRARGGMAVCCRRTIESGNLKRRFRDL